MGVLGHEPMPLANNSAHQQIVILARDHLMWAFAEAVTTIDVVQAVVALSLWKEPDDDKAAYYFNRVSGEAGDVHDIQLTLFQAIVLAKELDLGRIPSHHEVRSMGSAQRRDLRFRQRLW